MTPKRIIIHCSASEFGDVLTINKWHKERGWNGIGYHYVVLNGNRKSNEPYHPSDDGLVEVGRASNVKGAHVHGHNNDSLGICLIGEIHFSYNQLFIALPKLLRRLMEEHNIAWTDIYGHYQFDEHKTCPNLVIGKYLDAIKIQED